MPTFTNDELIRALIVSHLNSQRGTVLDGRELQELGDTTFACYIPDGAPVSEEASLPGKLFIRSASEELAPATEPDLFGPTRSIEIPFTARVLRGGDGLKVVTIFEHGDVPAWLSVIDADGPMRIYLHASIRPWLAPQAKAKAA